MMLKNSQIRPLALKHLQKQKSKSAILTLKLRFRRRIFQHKRQVSRHEPPSLRRRSGGVCERWNRRARDSGARGVRPAAATRRRLALASARYARTRGASLRYARRIRYAG